MTAEEYFQQGVEVHKSGDFIKAESCFTQAIELQPDDAAAYHNRGNTRYELGKWRRDETLLEAAIQDYSQAIALQPDAAAAYNNRGITRDELGKWRRDETLLEAAIQDYSQAIALQPDDAAAYHNRGTTYLTLGKKAKTESDYARCIHLASPDVFATGLSALIIFFRDHADVPFLIRCLAISSSDFHPYLPFLSYVEGELQKCKPSNLFLECLQAQLGEGDAVYQYTKALIHYFMGDEGEAFRLFNEVLDNRSEPMTLAGQYYYVKSSEDFAAIYRTSTKMILANALDAARGYGEIEAAQQQPEEWYYAGRLFAYAGEWEDALACFERSDAFPPVAFAQLQALAALGRVETRRTKFEALIQRIKREDYEEAYRFDNFNLFVAPDATDVVSQLLRYAQYLELSDVLREVYGLTYREKPFYQVFQPDELACNRFLLNHQKEKLSQVIQNDFIQHLQNQPGLSRDVEKELKNLNGSLRDDFDRLRNYAKEAPDNIESDLAQFIFDWKIEPHLERCRQKADVKGLYNHIIWYFALDGQLNPNSAICLQNYVYMVAYERREAPLLSLGSQESIADFSKEAFKEFVNVGLSSVPFGVGSLLGLPFGPAGVIVSGFVTRVSINHILKYMRQSRYQSGLGSEHYERFRQAFNEHVILEILKNKTDEFLRSETRKQLVEWQDRFRDFL